MINRLVAQFRNRQFLLFLLTGGFAALVNFGSRIVYDQWMSFSLAIFVAYLTGMITAYLLARSFVFTDSTLNARNSFARFVAVNAVAVVQTWAVSVVLAAWLLPGLGVRSYVPEIAHAVGVIVPVFTSYLGHKYWSFT